MGYDRFEPTIREVAELPPPERTSRYTEAFIVIARDHAPGTPMEVGRFASRSAARMVRDRIVAGTVDVPGGAACWELVAKSSKDGSTLYARFLGFDDDEDG